MPDFNFTISLPVHADMTPFQAEVKAGVEEAMRGGVSVPVGGRGRTPLSAGENSAVSSALAQVQQGYRLPGGYTPVLSHGTPGGDLFASARNRVANLHAQVDELRSMRPAFDPNGWMNVPQATGPGGSRFVPAATANPGQAIAMATAATTAATRPPNNLQLIAAAVTQQQATQAATQATARATQGGRSAGNLLGTSTFRGLAGALAIGELGNAAQAIRLGERAANLAESPEEAELVRAESVVSATSGFFGSLLTFPFDVVDSAYSPAGRLADAREAVTLRDRRVNANRATADRYAARRDAARELADTRSGTRALGQRGFARQIAQNIGAFETEKQELLDNVRSASEAAKALPGGQARELALLAVADKANRLPAQVEAAEQRMNAANREIGRQAGAALGRYARRVPSLQSAAEGRFGESEERGFEADLGDAQAEADELGPAFGLQQRNANVLSRQARRARRLSDIRTRDAGTDALSARLNRAPPAVSDLIELGDSQRVDLANARDDQERSSINRSYDARRAIVAQQFSDRKYDINVGLDSSINQSALRTRGGANGRLAASLDELVQRTRSDALGLEREGLTEEAGKRRRLGEFQVREAEANYYRSVQFSEVSGGRIAGGGDRNPFSDVSAKFRKAEQDAGKRGPGEPGAGGTDEKLGELVDLMRQFFNRNFRAKAG